MRRLALEDCAVHSVVRRVRGDEEDLVDCAIGHAVENMLRRAATERGELLALAVWSTSAQLEALKAAEHQHA